MLLNLTDNINLSHHSLATLTRSIFQVKDNDIKHRMTERDSFLETKYAMNFLTS